MTEYRISFIFEDREEEAARKWPTEAEARAYAAGLQKAGGVKRVRMFRLTADEKPERIPLKEKKGDQPEG